MKDETGLILNRREHEIVKHLISEILPTHFVETYPKLTRFLELYYLYLHSVGTPTEDIHDLYTTGDITQIDSKYLVYMEEQLLLGQSFFRGLNDSRLALKLSNTLYKTKGSKYSLEQFFRIFFGVDAEVIYTKENIFILNDPASEIGAESFRYLVNDKLYQTFALLIRTSLAVSDWLDLYKLFVHPAGMYVGGETVIVPVGTLFTGTNPYRAPVAIADSDVNSIDIVPFAALPTPYTLNDLSGIVPYDADSVYRIGFNNIISLYDSVVLSDLDNQYNDIREIMTANSPTFDMDSVAAGGDSATIGFSNTIETMDQNLFSFYDSV